MLADRYIIPAAGIGLFISVIVTAATGALAFPTAWALAAPENTLAAFRAAHAHGASSMEIDTVLTADNQIVVLHDLLLDRTTNGTGAAKDLSAAEIVALDAGSWFDPGFAGERAPTLRAVLDLARELDLALEIEVKEKLHLEA
ncbi:MAG: hypothetical protein MO852_12330 [Candidatus Devosia euplotis]|nr:hypothetical protein [Candidatus Devosia euplotis]